MAKSNQIILASHVAVKFFLKMKKTLNQLALASFARKARKFKTTIFKQVIDEFDLEEIIQVGSTVILWSEQNGFQEIEISTETSLLYLEISEKYNDDDVTHFSIYHPSRPFMTIQRCSDDSANLGLKWMTADFWKNEESIRESDMRTEAAKQGVYF